ncbi:cell division control protein 4 [Rickenella mellea]|uniref:Cell division control protein 4 n=1 Tax=Rickenella mellea TaxID=50990 RepID=A0A4Y7Q078_9AGAM|nr:cell division control protein 4 [Rickenella mellea]
MTQSRLSVPTAWLQNSDPKRLTFPAHGSSVVTCLLFSHGRIISASDDHSIHVNSPITGELVHSLDGHQGGVWSLAATKNTLVSGSTDRTVRVWDLGTGRCTHVFGGHTSTVRCVAIVRPEWIDITNDEGVAVREKWPKRSVIVTGSRDHSLRVWALPEPGSEEYGRYSAGDADADAAEVNDLDGNPYHKLHLVGHEGAVRDLAARGRTVVSGSFDCSIRVWDIITGETKFVLTGHTKKVYSVVYDPSRNQAYSGSMDSTVRMWNLNNGQCMHILSGHESLVGILGLSPSHLVSASADSTLRIWDSDTGELRQTLAAHSGAITCFQHDDFKLLSGSDGSLKMWDVRDGSFIRDLLTGVTGVWQVVFEGRWCVAASNRLGSTVIDVWDFGHGEPDATEGIQDDDKETEDEDGDY